MYSEIENYIKSHLLSFNRIDDTRKLFARQISKYILTKSENNQNTTLTFICTHNSRRSQFAQVWTQIAAAYFDVENIECFSGGTESSFVYSSVIESLKRSGIKINKVDDSNNPKYECYYDDNAPPVVIYSKQYHTSENPQKQYCAVMTCGDADRNCPTVFGADKRIKLSYDDPSEFDGKSYELDKYIEKSVEIGRELFYALSVVKI